MTSIVDDCSHHYALPDVQSTLCDTLRAFGEDLAGDVTADELSLPAPDVIDDTQAASGSSLPATPAERPGTFCPSSLPLPPAACPSRATLVLDLDGTLIASEELNAASSTYLWNPHASVRAPDYEAMGRRVWLRPGVREFLVAVRPHFEVALFTAATQNWAATAIEQLDPAAELFDVMLHRDHTTSDLMWDYVKDLSRLGRDLARTVIVDDNPLMFMYQPDNALHIGAYEAASAGGPDNVLERVADLLISKVAVAGDVREILGPMASAKSCIVSTIAAATNAPQGTPENITDVDEVPVSAASDSGTATMVAAVSVPVDQNTAVDSTKAVGCDVGAMAFDAVDSSDTSSNCQDWDTSACESSIALQQQADMQQHEDSEQHEQAEACGSHGSHCGLITGPEEFDWESDSEGAEAFDEHGAAAQLGADVQVSSYRHLQVEQLGSHADQETELDMHLASEVREDDSAGDSPQVELRHEGPCSDDFEALMVDAIAEYDSDAYDGPYDKEYSYDEACPAHTASAGLLAARGAVPAPSDACNAFRYSRNHALYGSLYISASYGTEAGGTAGFHVSVRSASVAQSFEGCRAQSTEVSETSLSIGAVGNSGAGGHSFPITAAANVPEELSPASAVDECQQVDRDLATAMKTASNGAVETEHLQMRQPSLPTGMVFLTDLNPSFGSSGAAPDRGPGDTDAKHLDVESGLHHLVSDGGFVPSSGCKRVHCELAAAPSTGLAEDQVSAACDDAPPSKVLRLSCVS